MCKLFNNILESKRMIDDWKKSTLVPYIRIRRYSKLHKLS